MDWENDVMSSVVSDGDDSEEEEEDEEGSSWGSAVSEEELRRREELRSRRFSLKRLVRLLHVDRPVFHVMAILGKK